MSPILLMSIYLVLYILWKQSFEVTVIFSTGVTDSRPGVLDPDLPAGVPRANHIESRGFGFFFF